MGQHIAKKWGEHRCHVLIIEDDRALETVLDRVIKAVSSDAQVDWVNSAEEAQMKITEADTNSNPYDLVIADIYLDGDRTGVEFWQECQDTHPSTSVLMMSSLPIDRFFNTIGQENISPPYLQKPFRIGECRAMLEGLLHYKNTS